MEKTGNDPPKSLSTPYGQGIVESIQVGRVRQMVMPEEARVDYRHPNWTSGIFKTAVAGPVEVTPTGIAGDEQADLDNHGGPDNVVLTYDAGHYPLWRERLALPDLPHGSFGESFTVRGDGLTDHQVCIGDIWQIGPVLLQVTQARQPCYKLARRLRQPHIVKMVHETSWGGWYLRVLQPGPVAPGASVRVVERPHPAWTVARAVQTMYARKRDPASAAQLAQLPELSARWKRELLVG